MRRFFQFRVTTLLLLIAVCAVALGWWQDHRNLLDRLREADYVRQALVMGESETSPPQIHFETDMFMTWEKLAGPSAAPRAQVFEDMLIDTDPAALNDHKYAPAADALPRLIELLRNPDAGTRSRAASTLGACGSSVSDAVLPLAHALEDRETAVRWNALYALASMPRRAGPAIPAIWDVLEKDNSPMAVFAARVVRNIEGQARFAPRLIQLLESHDAAARIEAFRLLATLRIENPGDVDPASAVPVLLRCLLLPDKESRQWAAYELAELAEPPDAIPSLLIALQRERDDDTKKRIVGAIFSLQHRRGEMR